MEKNTLSEKQLPPYEYGIDYEPNSQIDPKEKKIIRKPDIWSNDPSVTPIKKMDKESGANYMTPLSGAFLPHEYIEFETRKEGDLVKTEEDKEKIAAIKDRAEKEMILREKELEEEEKKKSIYSKIKSIFFT